MGMVTRRIIAGFVTLLLSAAAITVGAGPAQSAATPEPQIQSLTGIRTAAHPAFDRIVLDFTPGFRPDVSFQGFTDELYQDPTGEIAWLTGCVFAGVSVTPARAHDDNYNPTYSGPQKFRTRNLNNVMAVAITGDFEALLSIGIGMRKQTWVKVFTLTGPDRVVIDVGR